VTLVSFVIISKDEPSLARTLDTLLEFDSELDVEREVIVVDASQGRLEHIHVTHPEVVWIDYEPPTGVDVAIPHQRNHGVRASRGDLVVFTDSGCEPDPGWADALLAPILAGDECVISGRTLGSGSVDMYDALGGDAAYLEEAPTINIAFAREVFDAVGGFDESFAYGSDVDFAWRVRDAGYRIRYVPDAIVRADWGTPRRQLRRAYTYGRARARLYRKHRHRIPSALRANPVPFAYGAFLLGLPLTARFRAYPLLLILPAMRNRRTGVVLTVADHLLQGLGFLRELVAR
jgi:Glycosyl transferase family group 2/Glycosyl transferase family 2